MFRIYDFDIFKSFVQSAANSNSYYELIGYYEEKNDCVYFDYTLLSSAGTFFFRDTLDRKASTDALSFVYKYLTIENCYLMQSDMAIRRRKDN